MRWISLFLVFSLVGCTPKMQNDDVITQEARIATGTFCPGGKTCLPIKQWWPEGNEVTHDELPAHTTAKAIILALHGFNDYSNAFDAPARYLNAHGIAMIAYDQRGFGASGQPGIWGGMDNLTRDVERFTHFLHQQYPATPIYILGESMGGAVAIQTAATYPEMPIEGLILSAPAVWGDETLNPLYRLTLWTMAYLWPDKELSGGELKIQATDNIEMLRAMSQDPLVRKRSRIDAIYGLVQLMDNAYSSVDALNYPVLLLYGANDEVIPKAPIYAAQKRMTAPNRMAVYPNGWHMLLRDLQAATVLNDIVYWINTPAMALPSGYDALKPQTLAKSTH